MLTPLQGYCLFVSAALPWTPVRRLLWGISFRSNHPRCRWAPNPPPWRQWDMLSSSSTERPLREQDWSRNEGATPRAEASIDPAGQDNKFGLPHTSTHTTSFYLFICHVSRLLRNFHLAVQQHIWIWLEICQKIAAIYFALVARPTSRCHCHRHWQCTGRLPSQEPAKNAQPWMRQTQTHMPYARH